VLVVGFNPSPTAAQLGHFYAHPGNAFWRLMREGGLLPGLRAEEDGTALRYGVGFMDLSDRPTRSAAELTSAELAAGARRVRRVVEALRPRLVAFTGKGVYRAWRGEPRAVVAYGPTASSLVPGVTEFVLPSPSGRSGLPYAEKLAWYRALARLAGPAVL
jgi:TDG/mug DNA glycosylase family protein